MADFATECDLTARVPAAAGPAAAAVLAAAQASVIAFLNWDPRPVRATETYDGTGTPFIPLKRRPTTEALIYSLVERDPWDETGAGITLTINVDFRLRDGHILERIGRVWPYRYERPPGRLASEMSPARAAVVVDYAPTGDAGLLGVCKEAVLSQATAIWNSRRSGLGVQISESIDGVTEAFQIVQLGANVPTLLLSPVAQLLLRPFRRPAIGGL